MSPKSISRGASRPYRSALRQQQADATRSRVVASAAKLFAADGYARTTLAKIAADAGVSAETVQGQGPKAALLIAAIEYAAFGVSGEENLLNLDVGRQFLAIDDPAQALDFLSAAQTEVHQRCAELGLALIGAATADPELDRYQNDLTASVTSQIRRVLEVFRDRGWLRDDVPFDELVETAAVLGGFEVFLRVTRGDGWSVDAYRAWNRRVIGEALLP
ncbi:TetR/AcrR family transcriptional regulator [Mycobacterium deserti]|uniref:TetR/AcrR family transcriptional regulator n=1 Tax=Mycobacterium deserti TaxID=2978347 RepID=A0ABT2M729_9MYCO|nr:TetR/AcrR family transcriptional regulator [Mycobacterium deserti]MCT7657220.1 TetR/AcrR family transcriptional regulator [Mycobacterium deserti]